MPGRRAHKHRSRHHDTNPYGQQKPNNHRGPDPGKELNLIGQVFGLSVEKYNRYQSYGFLDCSDLKSISEIESYNVTLNASTWCKVIVMEAKKHRGCKALSLDNNKIQSLYHIGEALREIELDSLSLGGNMITSIDDIRRLRPLNLKHLVLSGNPIYNIQARGDLFKKLIEALPTLVRIDNCQINRSSCLDKFEPKTIGLEKTGADASIVQFIGQYFMASEKCSGGKGVDELLEFYDRNSSFSFTVQDKLSLALFGKGLAAAEVLHSHQLNILRNNKRHAAQGRLDVGKLLETLHMPSLTYHSNSLLTHTETSRISATMYSVIMHGKISYTFPSANKGSNVKNTFEKYFDRTWLITQNQTTGSPSILNDMFHIRDTKKHLEPVFKPAKSQEYYGLLLYRNDLKVVELCVETGLSESDARNILEVHCWKLEEALVKGVPEYAANYPNVQIQKKDRTEVLVEIFSKITRLTPAASRMCLTTANLDLWQAYEIFLLNRNDLDPSMFLQET